MRSDQLAVTHVGNSSVLRPEFRVDKLDAPSYTQQQVGA